MHQDTAAAPPSTAPSSQQDADSTNVSSLSPAGPTPRKRRKRFAFGKAAALLVRGLTFEEAARELGVSAERVERAFYRSDRLRRTIEAHRRRLADRIGWRIQSRRELIAEIIDGELEQKNWRLAKWLAERLGLEHVPGFAPLGGDVIPNPRQFRMYGRYAPVQLSRQAEAGAARPKPVVIGDQEWEKPASERKPWQKPEELVADRSAEPPATVAK